mmetsp:Transcript_93388/g.237725  ORF Transcript_93388/g.237725 Transcript_93388/m.237725 type:complete len:279 (+) Transcript_93388:467-1303(+)
MRLRPAAAHQERPGHLGPVLRQAAPGRLQRSAHLDRRGRRGGGVVGHLAADLVRSPGRCRRRGRGRQGRCGGRGRGHRAGAGQRPSKADRQRLCGFLVRNFQDLHLKVASQCHGRARHCHFLSQQRYGRRCDGQGMIQARRPRGDAERVFGGHRLGGRRKLDVVAAGAEAHGLVVLKSSFRNCYVLLPTISPNFNTEWPSHRSWRYSDAQALRRGLQDLCGLSAHQHISDRGRVGGKAGQCNLGVATVARSPAGVYPNRWRRRLRFLLLCFGRLTHRH